ncbi:hypothetical protein [Aurantimonas sp. NFXS3]|uniref:hypothetical protein n=1 Tax=Aurantimonas sp. NFXS3 TaxID=2818434 RepID=UPI003B8ACF56
MTSERELREAVRRLLDSLAPIVETYGGLDPNVLVDLISDDFDTSNEAIEAAIRDEANKREIPLVPVHHHTEH